MKTMTCPCGEPLSGDTDAEFVNAVKSHLTASHPEMSGHYTDEQILSRAQDA
jgi:hypothetical protein